MIGKVIQQKRKELGLTQAQLAERLGVTAPAVNRWEKDLSFPDATLLAPLARCLKTDLNELFSFYDTLSEKDRELIVSKSVEILATEGSEELLEYIEETLRQNPADGLLYKQWAEVLLGFHLLEKASDPLLYLDKVSECYERALELLPEDEEEISNSLISVYAEMGDAQKAAKAWERLRDHVYDKELAHVEMLCNLKDFASAIREYKGIVLRKVCDLFSLLSDFRDALAAVGDADMASVAEEKAAGLRNLFGLWDGFDLLSRFFGAIAASDPEAEENHLMDLFHLNPDGKNISSCPLFDGVELGKSKREGSGMADRMANLLDLMKSMEPDTE